MLSTMCTLDVAAADQVELTDGSLIKGRIVSVDIDESLLQPSEKQMVEDLVAAAINDARSKADVAAEAAMRDATGGLQLPQRFHARLHAVIVQVGIEDRVARLQAEARSYSLLAELNTRPRTTYLAAVRNVNPELES